MRGGNLLFSGLHRFLTVEFRWRNCFERVIGCCLHAYFFPCLNRKISSSPREGHFSCNFQIEALKRRTSIEEIVVVLLQNKHPQLPAISSLALYKKCNSVEMEPHTKMNIARRNWKRDYIHRLYVYNGLHVFQH
ncbi:hypothetical protein L6452_16751 [Arctium lappa]|uniref:Uncharacterized protein n=1 Tax=Arctium lappa TaxID=4217 RepID=A0ACB9C1C6_ARCLA|nr:hypothetical protein L6452_16751 [Arctium lappa]